MSKNKSGLCDLTILELRQKLQNREIGFLDIVNSIIARIKQFDQTIRGYISLFEEPAINQAKNLDATTKDFKNLHLLTGIPIAIKDNICVKDQLTTCGSKILANFISPYDATAVRKLKDVGAIIIGKTNLDEFAMGSSTETSFYGPTLNPLNPDYVPGGSSGGSAAVVRYGGAIGALGSDTGGSVRQPAAFCGVVGLKPTYGRVSRFGLVAFASSLDCIGQIAKSVDDVAIIFNTVAGYDEMDATSINKPVNSLSINPRAIKDYIIGVPKEYFIEGLDEKIAEVVEQTVRQLKKQCREIKEISLPNTKYSIATYYLICMAEASSNLARYDGVKYGLRIESNDLKTMYENTRNQGFNTEVKRRILIGTYGLSKGYYEEYYGTAQKARNLIKQDFDNAFKECDVIITPTTPTLPFKLGEKIKDPLAMYLEDIFTTAVNLAGITAVSVPAPQYINNFPVGIQIIGPALGEELILNCAKAVEELSKA
ncbi:MAG: Asp-tRNA(Asn)/Glu-tRNA(Gln) amidotransferase subunit GatA [candidate division WOR-3 bacterium]|nr:Asp-tRNA(Asn)/Glu-tRNA(Gln) amidotransferase subunit GatA [candidate division WOR-3 bacterium]